VQVVGAFLVSAFWLGICLCRSSSSSSAMSTRGAWKKNSTFCVALYRAPGCWRAQIRATNLGRNYMQRIKYRPLTVCLYRETDLLLEGTKTASKYTHTRNNDAASIFTTPFVDRV
jgi:hypothetical protein